MHDRAHSVDAARASANGLDCLLHNLILHICCRHVALLEEACCRRVGISIFSLDLGEHKLDNLLDLVNSVGRNKHVSSSFERNRIMETASYKVSNFHVVFLYEREKDAGYNLIGIGSVQYDILA